MVKVLPLLALAMVSSISRGVLTHPVARVTTKARPTDPNPVAGVKTNATTPELASATIQRLGKGMKTRVQDAAGESSHEERARFLASMPDKLEDMTTHLLHPGVRKNVPTDDVLHSLVSKVKSWLFPMMKRLEQPRYTPYSRIDTLAYLRKSSSYERSMRYLDLYIKGVNPGTYRDQLMAKTHGTRDKITVFLEIRRYTQYYRYKRRDAELRAEIAAIYAW